MRRRRHGPAAALWWRPSAYGSVGASRRGQHHPVTGGSLPGGYGPTTSAWGQNKNRIAAGTLQLDIADPPSPQTFSPAPVATASGSMKNTWVWLGSRSGSRARPMMGSPGLGANDGLQRPGSAANSQSRGHVIQVVPGGDQPIQIDDLRSRQTDRGGPSVGVAEGSCDL